MPELSAAVRSFLADSYPHNHGYGIVRGRIRPNFQLRSRWRKIRALLTKPMDSFLDLGCSKGFFVLQSALEYGCKNSLGIDIATEPIDACRAVQAHLGVENAHFEVASLHELAQGSGDYAAPFDTVLLMNTYQYLFFGSRISAHCYRSHEEIFAHLDAVTSRRLIFSNRLELELLPRNVQERAQASGRADQYRGAAIREAAAKFFKIEEMGKLGRIPLWQLTKAGR